MQASDNGAMPFKFLLGQIGFWLADKVSFKMILQNAYFGYLILLENFQLIVDILSIFYLSELTYPCTDFHYSVTTEYVYFV